MEPLLLIVLGVLGIGATLAFCIQMRRAFELEETISALKGDMEALKGQVFKEQTVLKEHFTRLSNRQGKMLGRFRALEGQVIANRSYDHAIRLVKGGADLGELVDMCGLSPGEAQLVSNLHQKNTPEKT